MRKIPTLFKRDPENMRRVLPEVTPGCEWVLAGEGVPTRKFDGTCVRADEDGEWWARREVKPGKLPPQGFVTVSLDEATGKTVGWEPIAQSPFAKFHAEAVNRYNGLPAATYELYGPKINGNPEDVDTHRLILHGGVTLADGPRTYEALAVILGAEDYPYEGIVWHHPDGRMAKLKRRDFA